MNQKTLINLTLVLLLGLGIIFGKDLWQKYQAQQPNEYQKSVATFNQDAVNALAISQGDQVVELTKDGVDWKVASKSAQKADVEELISAFFPEETPLLVAESEDQHKKLKVTETDGTKILLKTSDNAEMTFIIGGTSGNNRTVSIDGQAQIYGLPNFPSISADPDSWYNLDIVNIEQNQIKKIVFDKPYTRNDFAIEQTAENTWKFTAPQEADANSDGLNTFAMSLNPFKAQDLAFNAKQTEYNQRTPELTLTIIDQSDQETKLDFFKAKAYKQKDYLVKRTTAEGEEFYVIDESGFEDINKGKEGFEKAEE